MSVDSKALVQQHSERRRKRTGDGGLNDGV